MSNEIPLPSSICFSVNGNRDDDEGSELTGPIFADEPSQEGDVILATDPYYCHILDRKNRSQAKTQVRSFEQCDFKMQIIQQQETLDALTSKLSQYEVENESLKAEIAELSNKLANTTQVQPATKSRWFSKPGGADGGGSMRMLLDLNETLMSENARLQVIVDVTRKSLQTYIKDHRKEKHTAPTSMKSSMMSGRTSRTSLTSSYTCTNQDELPVDSSHNSTNDNMLRNSLNSIPEQELDIGTSENDVGTSGDDWIIDGEDIESGSCGRDQQEGAQERRASRQKRAARVNAMLEELLEDDDYEMMTRNKTVRRRSMPMEATSSNEIMSMYGKGAVPRQSSELLVESGETETRRLPQRSAEIRTMMNRTHRRFSMPEMHTSSKEFVNTFSERVVTCFSSLETESRRPSIRSRDERMYKSHTEGCDHEEPTGLLVEFGERRRIQK
eukprot:CAMPEP_0183718130 /NCGR_PEP_ID=MMETSP0737-20130205/11471_1 /TAXON_ID=385413 /ORGANISM="Thalassiosira miniscula, Strain CCMP1093" /LENGTH=442 /DNA_ID=CAMNT_0025947627 /DNA_START=45 /DNA_END=1370 /DNA_ORIENTATION=+